MGGSVAMGTDCERRSTTASEEASPKTASRIAERDILFVAIAEIRRDEKADSLATPATLHSRFTADVGTIVPASDRRLYLMIPGHCTR